MSSSEHSKSPLDCVATYNPSANNTTNELLNYCSESCTLHCIARSTQQRKQHDFTNQKMDGLWSCKTDKLHRCTQVNNLAYLLLLDGNEKGTQHRAKSTAIPVGETTLNYEFVHVLYYNDSYEIQ